MSLAVPVEQKEAQDRASSAVAAQAGQQEEVVLTALA
jgi:hypothetical protein